MTRLLVPENVRVDLVVSSKKRLFEQVGLMFEDSDGIERDKVFDSLFARERLGSTGLGQGIAIPHGKLNKLTQLHGIFARLSQPIEFDAVDSQPVDLVFLLLAPESAGADHLKALARISRLFRDAEIVSKLRGSNNGAALYSILTEPAASHAA